MHKHTFKLIWKHPDTPGLDWLQCPVCQLRWRRATLKRLGIDLGNE